MENNTDYKFDICDSLDELDDIRKTQGALETSIGMDEKIQKLEFDAAAITSEIVQHFVDMRHRIARLEEDLKDAREELRLEKSRGRMNAVVARALGSDK